MEHDLVRAILANELVMAVTGQARLTRVELLDRTVSLLAGNGARVIRVESPDGEPLDLRRIMDQVVGRDGEDGGVDRVERFFDALTLPLGRERHLVLMIDDAQMVTADAFAYLALIGTMTTGQLPRLQILFAGGAEMWDRLPRNGTLAGERIATRFVIQTTERSPAAMADLSVMDQAESAPGTVPPRPIADRPPTPSDDEGEPRPADSHTHLRLLVIQGAMQQQRRTTYMVRILMLALLIVGAFGSVIVWLHFGEAIVAGRGPGAGAPVPVSASSAPAPAAPETSAR